MKINPTLALTLLFCTSLLCSASEPAPGRNLYAEIYAIRNSFENNRLGAYHPYGLIYALASDTVGADRDYPTSKEKTVRVFNLRHGKRPRPLVLRMNVGDTLTVKFTNHIIGLPFNIASRYASIHASGVGLKESILSDGSWVGVNPNSPRAEIWPGGETYYRWTAVAEGVFLMYSQASNVKENDAGQLSEGLFGAIVVEPAGAEYYRSQVTAEALALATKDGVIDYQAVYPAGYRYPGDPEGADRGGTPILNMLKPCNLTDPKTKTKYDYEFVHTDLTALITGPQAGDFPKDSTGPSFEKNPSYPERWKPWREFSIFYHDDFVNQQAFLKDESPYNRGNLEEIEQYPSDTPSDNFAINYGIAGIVPIIFANRIRVGPQGQAVTAKFEEFFLSSWACGDPAMPVDIPANNKERARATYAKYPDDPSNVYHSYMNDHVKFRILHAGSNLTHVHHLHAHQWLRTAASDQSHYLDSQTISPGATNTLDIVYGGSGNKNKTVGDSIFHCHFYPHFAAGMWALWRVHDVFEEGTPLLKGDEWPKIDANANGGWVRALPDGEIETGTPIPAIVPVPTIALAPKPAKIKLIEALAPNAKDRGRMERVGQVAQIDDNDLNKKLNPGFPFYIPGVGGQRAPHPPLDFALDNGKPIDGGLPRHLVLSADNIYEQHSKADFTKEIGQFATGYFEHGKATAVQLPEGGTKAEWVAMQNHATRFHDTKFPNGTQAQGDQRFTLNGLPPALGAPFADPYITSDGKVPEPQLPVRRYKAAAVQLDVVFNKKGWHYPQQRILTLWDDAKPTLQNARSPEPLFFRANSGEVVEFWHTNLVPNYYEWDNFQVRTPTDVIGQHIHLVKFDVTASDGAANGFNYEDGTFSPKEVRDLIEVINNGEGLYTPPGSDYAAWLPNQPSIYQWPVPAGAWTKQAPLKAVPHPVLGDGKDVYQEWEGAQTTIQRWYADPVLDNKGNDRTLRTVFTHDHFGPTTHQQAGLYAGLLVEPAGSKWLSNTDEVELSKGRDDGGPTSWQARIIDEKNPANSFREFALEFGDNQLTYFPRSKAQSDLYKYYGSGSFGPTKPPAYRGWRVEDGDPKVKKWAAGVNVKGSKGENTIFSQSAREGSFVVNYRNEPMPFRVNAFKERSEDGSVPPLVAPNRHKNPQVSLANAYASIERFDDDLNKQPQGTNIAPAGVNDFVYPAPFAGAGPFDPYTPLLRAYQGEKVQVRTLVGAQLVAHSFMITGLNWLYEPDYGNSGYLGAQTMGISEHFEMEFRLPADKRDTIDYLYRASSGQDGFEAGCWGLLRSYAANKLQADLPALQGSPEIKYPEIGGNTTKFKVWAVRVVKADTVFEYGTVKAGTVVNPNDKDPDGKDWNPFDQMMVYMLEEDLNIKGTPDLISRVERKPYTVLEPLILRCAAGEIVEIELFNYITNYGEELHRDPRSRPWNDPVFNIKTTSETSPQPVTVPAVPGTVGLDVQMLAPLSLPGVNVAAVNVGANNVTNGVLAPDQLVPAPLGPLDGVEGGLKVSSRKYAWYAGKIDQQAGKAVPVEFGAVNILPADHYQQQSRGLIGAIIVEPAGSTFRFDTQQGSNVPITRASATILSADGTTLFREFVAVFEDDNTVLGGSNINYSSAPLAPRLNFTPADDDENSLLDESKLTLDVHRVLSNSQLNPPDDPPSPVFAAAKGSPVRLRLLHPGGIGNDMCIALHGHVWQEEPWLENSTILGNNPQSNWQGSHDRFGPNSAFNLLLGEETGGAGGVNGILGDYLLRDFMTVSYKNGAWGIVRVGEPKKAVVSIMHYPGAFTTARDEPGAEGATASTFRSKRVPTPPAGKKFKLEGRITVDLATGVLAPTVTVTVKVKGAPDVKIPAAALVKRDGRWSTEISVAEYPARIVVDADSPSGGSDEVDIKKRAEVEREIQRAEIPTAEQQMAAELSLEEVVPPKAPIKALDLMRQLRTEK